MQKNKQKLKSVKQPGGKKFKPAKYKSKGDVFKSGSKHQDFTDDFTMPTKASAKWYESVPEDPEDYPKCSDDMIVQLQNEAEKIMESETSAFTARTSKSSEKTWMRSVMAKGTGRDKIAAYTLMIQEEPLYNLSALRSLVGLVKPGKKESTSCIDTLVELFTADLLRPNKKLKSFSQRPLSLLDEFSSGNPAGRRRRLLSWYFEDQLKSVYRDFVVALQKVGSEAVDTFKEKVIVALAKLLESNPEQEAVLLSNLVNKVGDPSKKLASKAVYCLTQVLHSHPNMKEVIINEVEKLLFRPNIGKKPRFYSICFLSQILFKRSDAQIAANLIKLYFSFFKACVKLGDVDSRMLSVLLTGVNRAYPYAREAMDSVSEQLETMYKVVHIAPFNISIHALTLLFQVADYKNAVSDRFYSVLYRKLLDPALSNSAHGAIFLNLVFRALKKDESVPRVKCFIKRLLQVCCFLPVPMMCGSLYTVSQLLRLNPSLKATTVIPSMKIETSSNNLTNSSSLLKPTTAETLLPNFPDDDSEDEHYEDVKLKEDGVSVPSQDKNVVDTKKDEEKDKTSNSATWDHKQMMGKSSVMQTRQHSDAFDPFKRNPLHSNGELCYYTELCKLAVHFHPTVALFASQILSGELVAYTGDPLKDFTLIKFLERFVFKNPKKHSEIASTPSSLFAKRQQYSIKGVKALPIRSSAYLNQEEDRVPVDERFLFKFLHSRRVADSKKHDDDDDVSDVDSVNSDEFEDMLDNMMKKKGYKMDTADDDGGIDFADELSKNIRSKKTKKKGVEDEDEDEEEEGEFDDDDDLEGEDDDDMDDEEMDDEEMDHLVRKPSNDGGSDDDLDMDDDLENLDDDEEDIDFDDVSEDEAASSTSVSKKGKKKGLDEDVFAAAEEFSELLEAAGSAREGTSGALANKDKSSLKQLNWEVARDRWVKGFNRFTKSGKGAKESHKKSKLHSVKKSNFKKNKRTK